jgi:multiple sugar transport system permease protein
MTRLPSIGGLARGTTLIATSLLFVIPLWWLFMAPTKTQEQLTGEELSPLAFGSVAALQESWRNLFGFSEGIYSTWLLNSILYAVATTVLAIVLCVPAGWALAMYDFRGRRLLLIVTLVTMIIPSSALILPLYLQMSMFGLLNSAWSVILPGALFPFGVYLSFLYFKDHLPRSLVEAARLDGCSETRILFSIGFPLGRPVFGLVGFFAYVAAWTNFFLPFVMLSSDERYPMQLGLAVLMSTTAAVNPINGLNDLNMGAPEAALAAAIAVLPLMLVFIVAQRYLVSGAAAGAVKG